MKCGFIIFLLTLISWPAALRAAEVGELRCEYQQNPLAIDTQTPCLSWQLDSGSQTAYQIVVDGLWDSGKVASDQSVNVPYAGKPLTSLQRCQWKVRV